MGGGQALSMMAIGRFAIRPAATIEARRTDPRTSAMVFAPVDWAKKSHKTGRIRDYTVFCALSLPGFRFRTAGKEQQWLAVLKTVGARLGWFVLLRQTLRTKSAIRACNAAHELCAPRKNK